jgi:hypothetical protein
VNWFFMTLIAQDQVDDAELRNEGEGAAKGAGQFVHIKVDDVQGFYEGLVSKGLEPAGEPQVRGPNREFMLRDPDGYKLVFFQKKWLITALRPRPAGRRGPGRWCGAPRAAGS